MEEGWCLIESDPGVFTHMIERLGVKGWEFIELHSLDDLSCFEIPSYWFSSKFRLRSGQLCLADSENDEDEPMNLCIGLIFLYRYISGAKDSISEYHSTIDYSQIPSLFFARQVIPNACATQAVLSILLNQSRPTLSEELASFKDFTADFDPNTKGLSIGNSDLFREVHNSFHNVSSFISEASSDDKDSSAAFHFISYLPHLGNVYQLDGLKEGPILIDSFDSSREMAWLGVSIPAIRQQIQRIQDMSKDREEIRFNLLACTRAASEWIEEKLSLSVLVLEALEAKLRKLKHNSSEDSSFTDEVLKVLPDTESELIKLKEQITQDQKSLYLRKQFETEKRQRWKSEADLRQHSFSPLIFSALKLMAERGMLVEAYEAAKK